MPAMTGTFTGDLTTGQFHGQHSSLQSCCISDQFIPAPEEHEQQQVQQPLHAPHINCPIACGTLASGV